MVPIAFLAQWGALAPQNPAMPPPQAGPLTTVCGLSVPAPARLPPAGSKPVLLALTLCFQKQGGASLIDPQTYLYYIKVRPSEPSKDNWVIYDEDVEQMVLQDFRRLWETKFLDDLSVEAVDVPLANGTAQ